MSGNCVVQFLLQFRDLLIQGFRLSIQRPVQFIAQIFQRAIPILLKMGDVIAGFIPIHGGRHHDLAVIRIVAIAGFRYRVVAFNQPGGLDQTDAGGDFRIHDDLTDPCALRIDQIDHDMEIIVVHAFRTSHESRRVSDLSGRGGNRKTAGTPFRNEKDLCCLAAGSCSQQQGSQQRR